MITQMLILDALTKGGIGVWSMIVLRLDEKNSLMSRNRAVGNLPSTTPQRTELAALHFGLIWIAKLYGSSTIKVRTRSDFIIQAINRGDIPDPVVCKYLPVSISQHIGITVASIAVTPHQHELSATGVPLIVQEMERVAI